MGIPKWVNHLILKQTSKISYINWVLKVTSFSLFSIEHNRTSWDTDTSKVDDMNPSWNGSESRPCRSQSFLSARRKTKENKLCKLPGNINEFILLFMSYFVLCCWFCLFCFFFYFICLFIFFTFKFRKISMSNWRIFKKLKTGE